MDILFNISVRIIKKDLFFDEYPIQIIQVEPHF